MCLVLVLVESKMCETLDLFAKQPWIDVDTLSASPSIGAHAMSDLPSEGILSPPHTDREVTVLESTVHSHTITSHLARGGLLHLDCCTNGIRFRAQTMPERLKARERS